MPRNRDRTLVIGRVVHYEDEREFECPAIVIGTRDSLLDGGNHVPPIDGFMHDPVHLRIFSPAVEDDGDLTRYNVPWSNTYSPGSYHWPDECDE